MLGLISGGLSSDIVKFWSHFTKSFRVARE